jgi:hypothetical protein
MIWLSLDDLADGSSLRALVVGQALLWMADGFFSFHFLVTVGKALCVWKACPLVGLTDLQM